ncbi:outer membrane protein assembly factor BamC [Psychromonas sp. Urea-02u-13]|uniref:outer membrane protein assembly factor BamC n=1 Tax=Psychromonas sp. Urea-02u-13 TaxID=2058326 RepID=UPI000C32FBA6|nr:outer membrane protein assembly factor BamC [Psychromonas sp. Urea-02u-13]PKG37616.1 outer membrane assembly protein BamC [Psychromonas sp. Urea-02u-13]
MKLTFKHSRSTAAVILALSLSACVRFDTRMQANGEFEYQDATLVDAYNSGDFSNEEARDSYVIPELTEDQKSVGFTTKDVDVRPPTQLMPVIDGVLLEKTEDGSTKIWFNAFNQKEDMQAKVWQLLESYLATNDVEIINKNTASNQIETGIFSENITFGSYFNENTLLKESSYKLTVEKQQDGHSVSLTVDALSYKEVNEGTELKFNLVGSRKNEIETRFVNDLLAYAYKVKESEQLEKGDEQPLAIKLGFDDNHQNTWIVESKFIDTWGKLPDLFTLLNFEIIEQDKNLGYFLLKYTKPSDDYWLENNIKPFELAQDEYFIQLGEVTGGTTSILWLDEDKKPLTDQKITEIYLSITDHVRGALIENEKQTQEF